MRYILRCKVAELPPPQGSFPTPNEHLEMNFYVRLGIFMASWQFIESGLSSVYLAALKILPERYESAKASFYRANSFNTRLDMISDVIKYSDLDEELKNEWKTIKSHLSACATIRNKIAHGIVYWAPHETDVGDKEMYISEQHDDPNKNLKDKKYYFSDVEDMSQDFDYKHKELLDYSTKLNLAMKKMAG